MIQDSVRGGQIFLHNIRMFKQISTASLKFAIIGALFFACFYDYKSIKSHDWSAFISLQRIRLNEAMDWSFRSKSNKDPYVKIKAKGEHYKIRHSKALVNNYLLNNEQQTYNIVLARIILAMEVAILTYIAIFIAWWIIGIRRTSKVIDSENKILTAAEAKSFLTNHKIAGSLMLDELPLVKNSETKHILIMGTTGTGKTNCFHTILKQVRAKKQPALVLDLNGDMVGRYYDASRGDKIINPLDARGVSWDFWDELTDQNYIAVLGESVFAGKGSSYDEMWNNTAKQVFTDAIEHLLENKEHNSAKLYEILATMPIAEVSKLMTGRAASSLMDPASDKTAQSIRANIIAYTKWLKYLDMTIQRYSTKQWINMVAAGGESWLFLSCPPEMTSEFRPIFAMTFELLLRRIMRLGKDESRRLWLVTDELPANGVIPSLKTALTQIRKYGGCILSAIQSMDQLYDIYGHNVARVLLSQFNTKIIFRTDDTEAAKIIGQLAGEVEHKEVSESVSYGAHEMRDGVQIGQQHRVRPVLTAKLLSNLGDREAYVKLPAPGLQFVKIKMKYVKETDKNAHFLERVGY